MGAVRRRPWYLRAGALIAAMVTLVIVPAVLLAADAVAAGPQPGCSLPPDLVAWCLRERGALAA